MQPRPDPAPVARELQTILETGSRWAQGGLDPRTGAGCYGMLWFAFGLAGIALPQTAEEGQYAFVRVAPPYQPWDVLLARFGHEADARHVLLLLAPPTGYHCSWLTNGVAQFSLQRSPWRRIIRHGLRYKAWA